MFFPRPGTVAVAAAALGCLALSHAALSYDAPGARPHSILLLIGDDHGLQLGCYGDKFIQTPHLDRLASGGVRFTHAFATVSSCSPSRSVLLTGLYNHTNGQYGLAHAEHNFHVLPSVKSLPQLLAAAGYHTGIIGKYHVNLPGGNPFELQVDGRGIAEMAEAAKKFFVADDWPFFLLVGFTEPHRAARGFSNDRPQKGIERISYSPDSVELPYFLPDQPEVPPDLAEYYEAISRLDQGVGLVLKALEDTGRAKETLVIYLSDNGMPFVGAKTTLYETGIHLPLIVASPTQTKRGVVNNAMASFVDIVPTVLDWAGVKSPPELPGRSLVPILEQENPQGWDEVYASHTFHEAMMYYPMRAVRTRKWKYISNLVHESEFRPASDLWNSPSWQGILQRGDKNMGQRSIAAFLHRAAEELYDLENDPNELNNLAAHPKFADVLAELRQKVREFQKRTKDPWEVFQKY